MLVDVMVGAPTRVSTKSTTRLKTSRTDRHPLHLSLGGLFTLATFGTIVAPLGYSRCIILSPQNTDEGRLLSGFARPD